MGYPVMIKATAGGGGRGMRLVPSAEQLESLFRAAQGEAEAAFGNSGLYMEKFIDRPRHVEVQILADRHGNVVHLGERDCSVQRRHQKLLEEAPSPGLSTDLRQRMGNAAVSAARSIGYEGAGTVEFLLDRSGHFYFMEMNTRIQVEHPVTEMVTGIDLIAEQLRIAGGEPISVLQEEIQIHGHAIECRINAEDPLNNFRPTPGKIEYLHKPGGHGVRVDTHVYAGYTIPSNYDSMIAKLIVFAQTREEAIIKMERALSEFIIEGPGLKTTIPLHIQLMQNEDFKKGNFTTAFMNTFEIKK
jgi:acetyl-CoA carboxylase biotin carboxylase subunit